MNPSREGLPPCMSAVIFDGRTATLVDLSKCDVVHWSTGERLFVGRGLMGAVIPSPHGSPTNHVLEGPEVECLYTDDPDEAQAAFERGAEWVRTGEMA